MLHGAWDGDWCGVCGGFVDEGDEQRYQESNCSEHGRITAFFHCHWNCGYDWQIASHNDTCTKTTTKTCSICKGNKTVTTNCTTCSGTGSISTTSNCTLCGGTGYRTGRTSCSHSYTTSHYYCSQHNWKGSSSYHS